jgi:8-oxo-dGTP pyrophosphatase MutT (NUDIX family)
MKNIAGVLIQKQGRFLLVQEKKQHVYGLWNLPSGHVEEGETFEIAAQREGEEETGYKLTLEEKINTFPLSSDVQTHVYVASIKSGEIKFDPDELLAVQWFLPEEIEKLPLREKFIIELVRTKAKTL